MPDLTNYISIILSIGGLIGGFLAMRKGYFKGSGEVQEQTILALKTRLDTLESQAKSDAEELARLRQIIATIRRALKRRGLHIEIDGDFVTLIDADGQRSTQVPPVVKQPLKKPVKLQIDSDEDDETTKQI